MIDATLLSGFMVPIGVALLSLDMDKFDGFLRPAFIVLCTITVESFVTLFWVTRIDLLGLLPPVFVLPYAVGGAVSMLLFWRCRWGLMGATGASVLILHAGLTLWEYPIQIPIRSPFMLFANLVTFIVLAVSVPLLKIGENKRRYGLLLVPPIITWILWVTYPPAGGFYTPYGFPNTSVEYWSTSAWTVVRLISVLSIVGIVDFDKKHIQFQDRVILLLRRLL
jgi:hypothetical protein